MAEQSERTPTVVVHDLSITYKVLGGDRRGTPEDKEGADPLRRLLRKEGTERIREVHAVKGVSFIARHGESIGVVGHNGSGKSTLLRAVAGLIPPSKGRLWVSGEPALLGVNAVLINKLSGKRNIYVGGQALGLSKAEIDAKFDDIVEFSGIGDAVYLPMSTYSSGMGARLRFAISTAATPDVLMIDEALATGDAAFRQRSAKRIAEIRRAAGTVFLVSHSNSSIREICDRVLWMDRGRLVMDGPTEQVLGAYEASVAKPKPKPAAVGAQEEEIPGTTRWKGSTRYQVLREATRHTWTRAPGCFVVGADDLDTARMVAPVAAALGWPMVCATRDSIPPVMREELGRLRPEQVAVVGDESAISSKVRGKIAEIVGHDIHHIDCEDAAHTGAQLLREHPPRDPGTVYLTRPGLGTHALLTSLRAAHERRAVVVLDRDEAPPELLEALRDLGPTTLVPVGFDEDWPAGLLDQVREGSGANICWQPPEGPMAQAASLWDDRPRAERVIVTGPSPLEMLAATVVSATTDTPLLFLSADRVPQVTRAAIARLDPREIVLCGPQSALPTRLRAELGELVSRPAV